MSWAKEWSEHHGAQNYRWRVVWAFSNLCDGSYKRNQWLSWFNSSENFAIKNLIGSARYTTIEVLAFFRSCSKSLNNVKQRTLLEYFFKKNEFQSPGSVDAANQLKWNRPYFSSTRFCFFRGKFVQSCAHQFLCILSEKRMHWILQTADSNIFFWECIQYRIGKVKSYKVTYIFSITVQCDRKRMQQIFKWKILSFFFGKSSWKIAWKSLRHLTLHIWSQKTRRG